MSGGQNEAICPTGDYIFADSRNTTWNWLVLFGFANVLPGAQAVQLNRFRTEQKLHANEGPAMGLNYGSSVLS